MKFIELKRLALALPPDEQKQLLDVLLLNNKSSKRVDRTDRYFNMWCDSLMVAMSSELGTSSRMFPMAYAPQAKSMLERVNAFQQSSGLAEIKDTVRKQLYNILARILVKHGQVISNQIKLPLTMKLVLQTTATIEALFDKEFPGYLRSGLVEVVLSMKRINLEEEDYD